MEEKHKVKLHQTTMTPFQREDLIRILRGGHNILPDPKTTLESLSKMNDHDLHKAWVEMCQYEAVD